MTTFLDELQCRTCLNDSLDQVYQPIFVDNIYKILMQCANLDVKTNDGLPKWICSECFSRLLQAQEFKTLAEVSDAKLRGALERKKGVFKSNSINKQICDTEPIKTVENMEALKMVDNKELLFLESNNVIDDDELSCTFSLLSSDSEEDNLHRIENIEESENNVDNINLSKTIEDQNSCNDVSNNENSISNINNLLKETINKSILLNKQIIKNLNDLSNKEKANESLNNIISNDHSYISKVGITKDMYDLSNIDDTESIPMNKNCAIGVDTSEDKNSVLEKELENFCLIECVKCKKGFSEVFVFNKHWEEHEENQVKEHQGLEYLTCSKCTESFDDIKQFEEHWQTHDINESDTKDTQENKKIDDFFAELKKMIKVEPMDESEDFSKIIDNTNSDKTENCDLLVSDKSNLENKSSESENLAEIGGVKTMIELRGRKVKVHGDDKLYICQFCGKSFSSLRTILKHKNHIHKTFLRCPVCCKIYSGPLSKHIQKHKNQIEDHNKITYICYFCSEDYSDFKVYRVHLKLHFGTDGYKCLLCSKFFQTPINLIEHSENHKARDEKEIPNTQEKTTVEVKDVNKISEQKTDQLSSTGYTCTQCDQTFSSWLLFKSHIKGHGIAPFSNSKTSKNSLTKLKNGCPICLKGFPSFSMCHRHIRKHHIKDLKCRILL